MHFRSQLFGLTQCVRLLCGGPTCVSQECKTHVASVLFAEYGTVTGDCAHGLGTGECKKNLRSEVSKVCIGQTHCQLSCVQGGPNRCTVNGQLIVPSPDPCDGVGKRVGSRHLPVRGYAGNRGSDRSRDQMHDSMRQLDSGIVCLYKLLERAMCPKGPKPKTTVHLIRVDLRVRS